MVDQRREAGNEEVRRLSALLTKDELADVLAFCQACLVCEREDELHHSILEFATLVGFEFVLLAHMSSSYHATRRVFLKNLSNPVAWMKEYDERGYLEHDPVRRELERRLARGEAQGVILWDTYDRKLSKVEEEIIARRTHYGLRTGFSAFCNSPRNDAMFLVSFASGDTELPDERAQLLGKLVVSHLTRCRKRLDLLGLVRSLTKREQVVAGLLVDGKTNAEIAQILEVTQATAKYHVANILRKLQSSNRQLAVSILIAERCLS